MLVKLAITLPRPLHELAFCLQRLLRHAGQSPVAPCLVRRGRNTLPSAF